MLQIKFRRSLLYKTVQLLLFCLLKSTAALAASCCGGGFATPSVITGDDRAQLTSSLSYSKIDTDVFSNGVWQKRAGNETSRTYRIEAAHIFADRFQAGFSLPILTRSKDGSQGGESTGLGDTSVQLGYEYLPNWSYHPWRPQGVGFISLTLPTGKSIYETSQGGIDSRGRGFFALGAGTVLTKSWVRWDANLSAEWHQAFPKPVSNSQMIGNIVPGQGGSFSLGTGYNLNQLRLGTSLAWTYEQAINVEGTTTSNGTEQQYATATASCSYLFADSWAGALSYSDQTIFGEPLNTTLSKSVQISLQKRWAR